MPTTGETNEVKYKNPMNVFKAVVFLAGGEMHYSAEGEKKGMVDGKARAYVPMPAKPVPIHTRAKSGEEGEVKNTK